jgi:hypothetical protein
VSHVEGDAAFCVLAGITEKEQLGLEICYFKEIEIRMRCKQTYALVNLSLF